MSGYAALVLAAGSGRRFGGAKLLAELDGVSVLATTLSRIARAPVKDVVLVTGAYAEAVEAQARACAAALGFADRLRIVHAFDSGAGMGASLRAGVANLLGSRGVFVILADMPCVPVAIFAPLIAALEAGAAAAAPTWRGRRGHPVLFGPSLLTELARATGDEGARELLGDLGERLALVPTSDDGVVLDVDRPQDLEALRTRGAMSAVAS